jgi:hypothetical protein
VDHVRRADDLRCVDRSFRLHQHLDVIGGQQEHAVCAAHRLDNRIETLHLGPVEIDQPCFYALARKAGRSLRPAHGRDQLQPAGFVIRQQLIDQRLADHAGGAE